MAAPYPKIKLGPRTCKGPWKFCAYFQPRQQGVALILLLTVLTLLGLTLFIRQFSNAQYQIRSMQNSSQALAEAKEALIGDAISRIHVSDVAYLRLPDIGQNLAGNPTEGVASLNFTGNTKNYSVLGKFPWKTLRTPLFAMEAQNAFGTSYPDDTRSTLQPTH